MRSKRKFNTTNLMYLPALILFTCFVFYPFLDGIRISLTDWNGYSQNYNYIGLQNYKDLLFDQIFIKSFIVTLIYGFGSTLIQQVLGLLYALLLDKQFYGRSLARTIIYLPVLLAGVIMGFMFYFIFQYNNGALNDIMLLLGYEKVNWLGNGTMAVLIILFVNSIQFCGVSMVIYLAGLQGIPKMYYEAASIDGVTPMARFFKITLPMLYPSIVASLTINLIGGLKLFGPIRALTNGGPGYASHSISTYISYTYFSSQAAGYAATTGFILFILIAIITVVTLRISSKHEVTY